MLGLQKAGRSGAKNKEKGTQSNDDDEEARPPNIGGQKKFPPQIKTVNMINTTHISKRERMCTLWDDNATEPIAPKYNLRSSGPITFDHTDRPTSTRQGSSAALVLDPIIDGFHLTQVLMDGGNNLNLLY